MLFISQRLLIATVTALWPAFAFAVPTVAITPNKSSAIYQTGEKIDWNVTVSGDGAAAITGAPYVIRQGGGTLVGQGNVTFNNGSGTIETSLDKPGTLLLEVTVPVAGQSPIRALGGAAVAPEQIDRSSPCPDDFDAFWKSKLDELATVPDNPVLTKEDSGRDGVDYWKITLDNVGGTHVQGQLARPSHGDKFPAMLVVQWAGVYPLDKNWATGWASGGWLVLNISAHDLPIDQPKAFYDDQAQHALKDYITIGHDDREKSYFLRMFLGDCRAAGYLSERPDWNGKALVVTGASQGGFQSFATAALDPKITAMLVVVPAGCDNTGALAGRKPAWPFYIDDIKWREKDLDTSRYFDAVNFAARVKCPALVALGLIDETAPPSGVFAAVHQLQGPKEVVVMPNADHMGTNNSQVPFFTRQVAWFSALQAGAPPPIIPWTGSSN